MDTKGQVKPYAATPDFSNVVLGEVMTDDQKAFLLKNAFVVSPSKELEFYTPYEKARYNYQPLFITTDSLLHTFHLAFGKVLRTAETESFYPLILSLNAAALAEADRAYTALKGTDWEQAALHTVAYLGMASRLAVQEPKIPAYAKPLVDPDYAAAMAAQGISPSKIFPELEQGEDWSQYKPRGYYTNSEQLSNYFRAMMWYGRLTFRLSKPEETKAAILLTLAIRTAKMSNRQGLDAWNALYEPTVFFVGKSDDLTILQYNTILAATYGANANAKSIQAKGTAGVDAFVAEAQKLPKPRILNIVIRDTDNIEKETKGLRFMGQRFVWDAYVLRELTYRNVGTRDNPRAIPSALDVFAALGAPTARAILDSEGATKFENYTQQLEKVSGEVKAITEGEWTETLYNAWLYTANTLNQTVQTGYPSFMLNPAYQARSLYATLSSYAELKHDTVLYAEQSYAERGGGGGKSPPPEPIAPPNYVEPVPLFWARLAALAEMTLDGLGKRDMINEYDRKTLESIAKLARKFQTYAQKELRNELLTGDEQEELRFYGADLEALYKAVQDNYNGQGGGFFQQEPRAAIITDIATDPQSAQVLQIGTGYVYNMYVIVPVGDKLWLMRGAVSSFYQFKQPLSNRLTDEQWWKMLDAGKAPPLPAWTATFITDKSVDADLAISIKRLQDRINYMLWYDPSGDLKALSSSQKGVDKYLVTQLTPLAKAKQYEGRQIIETSYRSVDMKNATTAIVTTRETWRGELYNESPNGPDEDGMKVAERGPYTVDVTYTLTYDTKLKAWGVTNLVVNGKLPDWKPIK